MHSAALLSMLLFSVASTMALPIQRSVQGTVTSLYGETIVVPCPYELLPGYTQTLLQWSYANGVGTLTTLLAKHANLTEADIYVPRVNISDDASLLISQGTLKDQGVYVCAVTSSIENTLTVSHVTRDVAVYKKPVFPVIVDKAEFLKEGALTWLGTCVARDAHPVAEITWQKNGQPLVSDRTRVVVIPAVAENSSTGLSTTSSTLLYAATKQDVDAHFSCRSSHKLGTEESETMTVPVHYPTKRLSLTVSSPEGRIAEGDDVTLKCHADGNPPPGSYNFHLKNRTVVLLVENSDSYTLTAVTRDSAGEYKCSLVDDATMEASLSIVVSYPDLSPPGTSRATQATVGVVTVLVLAVVAGTMAYLIYRSRRQGSWTLPHHPGVSLVSTVPTSDNPNVQLKSVVPLAS